MWIDIGSHGFDLGSVNPAYKAVRPKLNDQQKKNNSEFLNAIVGDDAQKVQAMLSNPDDFKFLRQAVTENGTPALVLAATKDNLEIVNALMYANFDLRVVNTHGNSALHWAARKGI